MFLSASILNFILTDIRIITFNGKVKLCGVLLAFGVENGISPSYLVPVLCIRHGGKWIIHWNPNICQKICYTGFWKYCQMDRRGHSLPIQPCWHIFCCSMSYLYKKNLLSLKMRVCIVWILWKSKTKPNKTQF